MKTAPECLRCYLRQAERLGRRCGLPEEEEFRLLQDVAGVVSQCTPEKSPPENAEPVYQTIHRLIGDDDPYRVAKQESNRQAHEYLERLEELVADMGEISDKDGLNAILRIAIAGNIMDFGALESFDLDDMLQKCLAQEPAIDHSSDLLKRITSLDKGAKVLYLADNCGEIVFDKLLVHFLFKRGFDITVAVKERPIINDAMEADARFAGLDRYAAIMSNGSGCPGTVLELCSPGFNAEFAEAELIIAKGQGNFESLSEIEADIFFLLTLKCAVAARHMALLNGLSPETLPGKGEMAIFFSGHNERG